MREKAMRSYVSLYGSEITQIGLVAGECYNNAGTFLFLQFLHPVLCTTVRHLNSWHIYKHIYSSSQENGQGHSMFSGSNQKILQLTTNNTRNCIHLCA